MSKKFGKFLLITAVLGGAAVAAYCYFRKKDTEDTVPEDEDYDDFSEDLDAEAEPDKKYVSLTPDADASAQEEKSNSFVPLDKVAQPAGQSGPQDEKAPGSEVEEFFDEEDGADKESVSKNK